MMLWSLVLDHLVAQLLDPTHDEEPRAFGRHTHLQTLNSWLEASEQCGSEASEPLARNMQVAREALCMIPGKSVRLIRCLGSLSCEEAC